MQAPNLYTGKIAAGGGGGSKSGETLLHAVAELLPDVTALNT